MSRHSSKAPGGVAEEHRFRREYSEELVTVSQNASTALIPHRTVINLLLEIELASHDTLKL